MKNTKYTTYSSDGKNRHYIAKGIIVLISIFILFYQFIIRQNDIDAFFLPNGFLEPIINGYEELIAWRLTEDSKEIFPLFYYLEAFIIGFVIHWIFYLFRLINYNFVNFTNFRDLFETEKYSKQQDSVTFKVLAVIASIVITAFKGLLSAFIIGRGFGFTLFMIVYLIFDKAGASLMLFYLICILPTLSFYSYLSEKIPPANLPKRWIIVLYNIFVLIICLVVFLMNFLLIHYEARAINFVFVLFTKQDFYSFPNIFKHIMTGLCAWNYAKCFFVFYWFQVLKNHKIYKNS